VSQSKALVPRLIAILMAPHHVTELFIYSDANNRRSDGRQKDGKEKEKSEEEERRLNGKEWQERTERECSVLSP